MFKMTLCSWLPRKGAGQCKSPWKQLRHQSLSAARLEHLPFSHTSMVSLWMYIWLILSKLELELFSYDYKAWTSAPNHTRGKARPTPAMNSQLSCHIAIVSLTLIAQGRSQYFSNHAASQPKGRGSLFRVWCFALLGLWALL